MNGSEKSDSPVVPMNASNNEDAITASSAEGPEGRGLAKGNSPQQTRSRAQNRNDLPHALERVRQAAIREKGNGTLTSLWHHVYDIEQLREAFLSLKRTSAPGLDGMTWEAYEKNLEGNLKDLSDRLRRGAYRAQPVRRVWIPKPDGRQRPLGVPTLEDKIVQRATATVLQIIYETEFLGFSYGFRPGRSAHLALDALAHGIESRPVSWVLDADIRGFFDAIDHDWLMRFIGHRITDQRVHRHIQKWLKAGVLEDGQRVETQIGTPQGSSISPLLANIYLHYVFDLWAHQWRRRHARGEVILVRFADDFVVGFQYKSDAEQFLTALHERFAKFHLELHPEKTRLIEFGRFAPESRRRRGEGKPETFNFLGFTHSCGKTRKGRFVVLRQTMKQRMRAKLRSIKAWLRDHLHAPVPWVGTQLRRVLQGYYQYFGVPRNGPSLCAFREAVIWLWMRSLRRRSQMTSLLWLRMGRLVRQYLPTARIVHPYPGQRLAVFTRGRSRMR